MVDFNDPTWWDGYNRGYIAGRATVPPLPPVPTPSNGREISRFWLALALIAFEGVFGVLAYLSPSFAPSAAPIAERAFLVFSGFTGSAVMFYFGAKQKGREQ